jgi:hypothetical protein
MKRMVCALCAVVCALVLAVSAMAQVSNVTGDWDVTVNYTSLPHKAKASFKQEGEKLTGVIRSQSISLGREMHLEGAVRGKEIRFTYILYISDMIETLTLSGAVEGDSMKGDVYLGGPHYGQPANGDWNAKRASATVSSGAPAAAAQSSGDKGGVKNGDKIDVTGDWSVAVEPEAGTDNPSFTFKQEGEKLTGKYKGAFGEADLTGTIKGDKIEFSFKVSGQIEGVMTYTGAIDGKLMNGKVKLANFGEGTFFGKKQ